MFDVIVIGAGPAGSVAAYQLASKHHRVLVIDQASFPRVKPCGGALPIHTLTEFPFDVKPVLDLSATGAQITWKGQTMMKTPLQGDVCWLAERKNLDAFLLQKACEAGVQCQTGVKVTSIIEEKDSVKVKAGNQTYSSSWLIGADGANSVTAKSIGLLKKRKTGIALEAEIAVPDHSLQEHGGYGLFDFGALPYGYGWIFPKKDHLSVGVYHANNQPAPDLKKILDVFIRCQPILKEHRILSVQGHRIPLGGRYGNLHSKRCLLAGDAANLADPWLGEGIYYAVRSANLSAQFIDQTIERRNTDLSVYTRRISEEIISDYAYARRVSYIAYHLPHLSCKVASRLDDVQQLFFSEIRGDLTFKQLWFRLMPRMPKYLFQTMRSVITDKTTS